MKIANLFLLLGLVSVSSFAGEEAFGPKMIAKLNEAVRNCNGPGKDPKPAMEEFVKYVGLNGYPGATVLCSISNYGEVAMPVITLRLADGGEIVVNYKKTKAGVRVQDVIRDANTPEGMKRKVLYSAPRK